VQLQVHVDGAKFSSSKMLVVNTFYPIRAAVLANIHGIQDPIDVIMSFVSYTPYEQLLRVVQQCIAHGIGWRCWIRGWFGRLQEENCAVGDFRVTLVSEPQQLLG
jgi:hypothetical protein